MSYGLRDGERLEKVHHYHVYEGIYEKIEIDVFEVIEGGGEGGTSFSARLWILHDGERIIPSIEGHPGNSIEEAITSAMGAAHA